MKGDKKKTVSSGLWWRVSKSLPEVQNLKVARNGHQVGIRNLCSVFRH